MKRSCAVRGACARAQAACSRNIRRSITMAILLREIGGLGRVRMLQELLGRRALDEPALVQEQDLVAEAPRLPEVVGHHHDLGARRVQCRDDPLDLVRGAGIEVRGRLVEEEHFGLQRPGAREREPLLLAAGQHARRALRIALRGRRVRSASSARAWRSPRRNAGAGAAHNARWRAPSAAASPGAETPSPAVAARPAARAHSSRRGPPSDAAARGTGAAARSCRRRWGRE